MKAAVYTNYGRPEVIQIKNVEQPLPKDDEVLIKIFATAVNSGDWRLRKADPFAVRLFFGLTKPKINILGGVFSGQVQQVGKDVTLFKVGDDIFGKTNMRFGAYAEYLCFPEYETIALKPDNISYKDAAVIPFGGTTALYFIKKAKITYGQKVLVYGASGAVGTAAIQLAKYYGAQVTGVCGSSNVDLLKSLGVDKVIDYTKEDFTKKGVIYDVIFDTVNKTSLSNSLKVLSPGGLLILSAAGMSEMIKGFFISTFSNKKVLTGVISHTKEDIIFLKNLIELGNFKPVVDRTYSLEQIVGAHEYVEKGHKKGNVAVTI